MDLKIAVLGPGTVEVPPDQACRDGEQVVLHCEQYVQNDRSVVVDAQTRVGSNVLTRSVRHFRPDGTVVTVDVRYGADDAERFGEPLSTPELTALVTDPQFALSR